VLGRQVVGRLGPLGFLADNLSADGYEIIEADCAGDGQRLMESKFRYSL
jgi:hypothetical protein